MNILTTQPIILGFPWLEDLVAQELHRDTVYLSTVADLPSGSMTISNQLVEAHALIHDGLIAYWRYVIGTQTLINGKPADEPLTAMINKATDEVVEIVSDWLMEHGHTVVTARLALPREYVYMRGQCKFLEWNATAREFRRRDAGPPPGPMGGRFA
jgi:hypothetical protein